MSKRTTKQEIQCCVYDLTIFDEIDKQRVREIFESIAKKWTFQLEKGEKTGKQHWQCRISAKTKCRNGELINKLKGKGLKKFHSSVTSKENRDNDFYCQKEETRLDGPYTDQNLKAVPRDVKEMTELRPWQKSLKEELATYNVRRVDVLIDELGNIGKTRFTRWMECYEDAETIDFVNDYKDLMRMAYDLGVKKLYMIDMPRAISKEKLFQFYGAIETLKSGKCFDDRYGYKKRLFDPPRVCLFMNKMPDNGLLSRDMWKFWKVDKKMRLKEFNNEDL